MVRTMTTLKRLRGLRSLVGDVVEHGSKAVQDVHIATAARTFTVLEAVPPIAAPAKVVHAVHDLSVSSVYGMIRLVNRAVGATLDVAIDIAETDPPAAAAAETDTPPAAAPPAADGDRE